MMIDAHIQAVISAIVLSQNTWRSWSCAFM